MKFYKVESLLALPDEFDPDTYWLARPAITYDGGAYPTLSGLDDDVVTILHEAWLVEPTADDLEAYNDWIS